jgi:hypothetical protein
MCYTAAIMQNKAPTVDAYLASLPEDRRTALQAVRRVILDSLDRDYEEGMSYGMIGYYVPFRVYPAGYHCNPKQPLPFAGLASQKGHMSLYIMPLYGGSVPGAPDESSRLLERFRDAWTATGRKLDMGKSCIRFKKLEELPLDVIGDTIRRLPARTWIQYYEAALSAPTARRRPPTSRATPRSKSAGPSKSATRSRSGPRKAGKQPAARSKRKARA